MEGGWRVATRTHNSTCRRHFGGKSNVVIEHHERQQQDQCNYKLLRLHGVVHTTHAPPLTRVSTSCYAMAVVFDVVLHAEPRRPNRRSIALHHHVIYGRVPSLMVRIDTTASGSVTKRTKNKTRYTHHTRTTGHGVLECRPNKWADE